MFFIYNLRKCLKLTVYQLPSNPCTKKFGRGNTFSQKELSCFIHYYHSESRMKSHLQREERKVVLLNCDVVSNMVVPSERRAWKTSLPEQYDKYVFQVNISLFARNLDLQWTHTHTEEAIYKMKLLCKHGNHSCSNHKSSQ